MAELKPIGRKVETVLGDIWQNRHFLVFFALTRVRASLSESRTAIVWWVLEPALKIIIYGSVFGLLIPASSRPNEFIVSLVIGITIFEIYSAMSAESVQFSKTSRPLMEQSSISPFALMASKVIEVQLRAVALILLVFVSALALGSTPTLLWLAFPLIFLGSSFFLYSIGLFFSALATLFPTFPRLLGAFNKVVFFASGIFWSVDKVLSSYPAALLVAELNPVYQIIELCRAALLGSQVSWTELIGLHAVLTGLTMFAGYLLFDRTWKLAYG